MRGAAEPGASMIAACDASTPASDLDVTVTNKARKALESFAYSDAGVNDFNSDTFGYETLAPGASREFTIPGGRDICTRSEEHTPAHQSIMRTSYAAICLKKKKIHENTTS